MRFSLKHTLIAVTLFSVYLGVLLTPDDKPFLSGLSFITIFGITIILPSINAAGIAYGKGYHRAFWIGVTAPCHIGFVFAAVIVFEATLTWGEIEDITKAYHIKVAMSLPTLLQLRRA